MLSRLPPGADCNRGQEWTLLAFAQSLALKYSASSSESPGRGDRTAASVQGAIDMVRRVAPNDDANGGDGARNGPSAHVESTFLSPLPGLCNSFAHLPTACAVGWILPPLPRLRRKTCCRGFRRLRTTSQTKTACYSPAPRANPDNTLPPTRFHIKTGRRRPARHRWAIDSKTQRKAA